MITSPMEQFSNFPIFNMSIVVTNSTFYFIIVSLIIITLSYLSLRNVNGNSTPIISHNYQVLIESFYHTVLNMILSFIGKDYQVYLPLLYTIFYMILFSNFVGLIPYSFTPTVEVIFTLSLAFTLLIGLLLLASLQQKFYLFAVFLPAGTPIVLIPLLVILEVIAYLFRTLSLGLRLAINLITGHVLAKVGVSFIWNAYTSGVNFLIIAIPIFLVTLYLALEILIAYLQSYIFIFITCLTFKDLS